MKQMTLRERFRAIMDFKPFDRLPVQEYAPWDTHTVKRWHSEGLPTEIKDRYEIARYFGLDKYRLTFVHWTQVPELRPEFVRTRDEGRGIVGNDSDYERWRELLFSRELDTGLWKGFKDEHDKGASVIVLASEGFFWFPRTLFGIEQHLFAFYDQPELIHRMNREHSEWLIKLIDQACEICVPDAFQFSEDMSYNKGAMLSKELFDEFLRPYYDKVVPHLKKRGIRVLVDSDGEVSELANWLEEAGIEGIVPLERQAGTDIAQLRADHPKMRFIGHFDKMTMSRGEDAMRQEFERLLPTAAKGGYIINCDHQTPPEVSLENYRTYLKLFREYAEKAGKMSQENLICIKDVL